LVSDLRKRHLAEPGAPSARAQRLSSLRLTEAACPGSPPRRSAAATPQPRRRAVPAHDRQLGPPPEGREEIGWSPQRSMAWCTRLAWRGRRADGCEARVQRSWHTQRPWVASCRCAGIGAAVSAGYWRSFLACWGSCSVGDSYPRP